MSESSKTKTKAKAKAKGKRPEASGQDGQLSCLKAAAKALRLRGTAKACDILPRALGALEQPPADHLG